MRPIAAATIKFHSDLLNCEWVVFDPCNYKIGSTVHHNWATMQLQLNVAAVITDLRLSTQVFTLLDLYN